MNSPDVAIAPAATAASELPRLRASLRQHQIADVLASTEALLAEYPPHPDLLLFRAIAPRHLRRIPDALSTLKVLEEPHPRFSRLHEERGRCHVDLKQAPEAIESFTRAVKRNPALLGAWRMLEGLYRVTGRAVDAADAASQAARLQTLPPEILNASGLYSDADLAVAEPLDRAYLLKHGHHVEAMRLLARIGMARQVYDDAEL